MPQGPKISKQDFLRLAALNGLDTSDEQHMDEVYKHYTEFMGVIEQLRQLDLGDVEPSNIFSPARE
jgi:Asp-tRNA(Asn)/Glu-tRNA(Gln) amidotransferase C subunit